MDAADHARFTRAYRITTQETSTRRERVEAFRIWTDLAAEGYVRSCFYLGVCLDLGIGTRKDRRGAWRPSRGAIQRLSDAS
jgi:TPR repeat protein